MSEPKRYRADAAWPQSAVDKLLAAGVEVVAPTAGANGIVTLAAVSSAAELAADYLNVLVPLKQCFLPPTEVLIDYERKDDGDVEVGCKPVPERDVVVMGARPCDAAAVAVLDKVFKWDYEDVNYCARRERTTVVTFACTAPDANCFCTSVGGSPHGEAGSDVVVFHGDDGALLEAHSPKGEAFIERLGDVVRPAEPDAQRPEAPGIEQGVDPDGIKTWLDDNFESDFWVETALRCAGCAACSYLCPTCHCFDIVDEALWNRGERRRNWDCCAFGQFTVHASGHNPRDDQGARFRQRIMHKFKYFPERFGLVACVGCGRCARTCGVGQSLLTVFTDIEARQEGDRALAE